MVSRPPTLEMLHFCIANQALAAQAVTRDEGARKYFGARDFNLYGQGNAKVIRDRAMAPAPGVAATSTPTNNGRKVLCSMCNTDVNDFTRHNRETHILDPAMTFYCPHDGCTTKITRDGQITRDDHLAGSHNDFRNSSGRGGELLVRSDKTTVLNKLTLSAARFVAKHRHGQLRAYEIHRSDLDEALTARGIFYHDLQTASFPVDLQVAVVDFDAMNKTQAIEHAIRVRRALNAWDTMFATAQGMLR